MFAYVPKLTRDQFFTTSYAQVKANMASDIVNLILQKLKTLQPPCQSNSCLASSSTVACTSLSKTAPALNVPAMTKKTSKTQIQADQEEPHLKTHSSKVFMLFLISILI